MITIIINIPLVRPFVLPGSTRSGVGHRHETEWDTRFVELGKHLFEVRAEQYWRVKKLKVRRRSRNLERRFPKSRTKAY
jgi:hypothetical protein